MSTSKTHPRPVRRRYKLITRIDHGSTHGWNVRIIYRGVTRSKLFSDGPHGGRQRALEAARAYRDREYRRLFKRPVSERREVRRRNRRNRSGVIGVALSVRKRNGRSYEYYVATWCPRKGEQARKAFSVLAHGRRRARQLAKAYREKKLREVMARG